MRSNTLQIPMIPTSYKRNGMLLSSMHLQKPNFIIHDTLHYIVYLRNGSHGPSHGL